MVEGIVNKIIVNGIKNFSSSNQSTPETTQIRIYFDENKDLKYDFCIEWQPKETVSFKQILNKKIDLLGYEAIATPFFEKSLLSFSEKLKIESKDISVFIFIFSAKEKLGLAVFDKTENTQTISMSKHLSELGLSY